MNEMYIPMMVSMGAVLLFLQQELQHSNYNHSFIIDEFLADIFLGFQLDYNGEKGIKAAWKKQGVFFPHLSNEEVDGILVQANNLFIQSLTSVWPDYSPVEHAYNQNMFVPGYSYNGGENLLLYMPYNKEKHYNVPRNILVPRNAVVNSVIRSKI